MSNNKNLKIVSKSLQSGFTLLEIIVVLGILGGLMAWVVSNVVKGGDSAKRSETQSRAATVAGALIRYNADVGRYPESKDGLSALVNNPGAPRWGGPYVDEDSLKDGWQNVFEYELTGKGPKIISTGADGQAGTADDLAYINGKQVEEAPASNEPKP